MNKKRILSLLCLTGMALQLFAAESAATGSAPSGDAGSPKAVSTDDLQQLRQRIAEQEEQIKRLEQAVKEQRALLEKAVNAVSTNAATAVVGNNTDSVGTTLGSDKDQVKLVPVAARAVPAPRPAAPRPAAAQGNQAKEKVEQKLSDLAYGKIKLGGTFFGDWAYYTDTGFGPQFLTQLNQDGPGNRGFNSFDVTRTYLNFLYTPNDAVTLRLTPNIYRQVDVSGAMRNGSGSAINSSSNGNLGFRLKYAYVQFNTLFKGSDAFKKDNLRVGQTMNPLVDWEEGLWGYRYVNLVPWNYLSLSSTYTGITLNGPIEFNGKEYLDYQIGIFNTASFHSIETNDKKQVMARLTWYPFGTTSDRTGLGITGFEDYGYNTKTPDARSTPLYRVATLLHYQTHSKSLLLAGEYDLGRNAFSAGNLFSGAGPADAFGLGPTQYAGFSALTSAILGGDRTRQQGFAFFGHVRLWHTPFSLFGMYHHFQPNTNISGKNPLDFARTVAGISYKFNDHFEFSLDNQNLHYLHDQFTMSAAQIATLSSSLAAANPDGISSVVPHGTNVVFVNLLFNY